MAENKEGVHFQVVDKRFWVKDDLVFDQARVPEKRYPSYVEELRSRTELAEQKLKEKSRKLDQDNEAFRERLAREMEKRVEREKLEFLRAFLEVADNFERALLAAEEPASLKEGVRLNLELLMSRLRAHGVQPLDVLNRPFSPHEAEAVGVAPVKDPQQNEVVVEVVQNGYRLGDQLLRPARVRVGHYQG